MIFSLIGKKKRSKNRAIMTVSLLACGAFVALAIFGWGLSLEKAASFLLITVILVGGLIGSAFLVVFLWHRIKQLFQ